VDYRKRRPIVICLEQGGKLVRLWTKGQRHKSAHVCTVEQIYLLAAANTAAALKAEKKKRREERKAARR
jgi:hypothetical protein